MNVNKCMNQSSISNIKHIKFINNNVNEDRYNKFAEDIKYYMNEKKKKIKFPYRKISFIEKEFSFFTFIFSLCCN